MILYKYFSQDVAKITLTNKFLKLSAPIEFNDPYEVWPYIRPYSARDFNRLYNTSEKIENLYQNLLDDKSIVSRSEFDKLLRKKSFKQTVLNRNHDEVEQWQNSFQQRVSNIIRIGCFTIDPRNLLMWSHYAEKHKGIVIGYDFSDNPALTKNILRVKYRKNNYSFDVNCCYGFDPTIEQIGEMLSWKYCKWNYEKEYRMVRMCSNLNKSGELYGIADSDQYIREIIVGCKTDDITLIKLIKSNNVRIYQERLKRSNYNIVLQESL
jgi:hypothetical protein